MHRARAIPFAFADLSAPDIDAPSASGSAPAPNLAQKTYEEGYQDGLSAARAESEQCFAQALESLANSVAAARDDRRAILDVERMDILAAARLLIESFSDRLHAEREGVLAIDLLDRLSAASDQPVEAKLHLSPAGYARFGAEIALRLKARHASASIQLSPDASLHAGETRLSWRGGMAAYRRDNIAALLDDIFADGPKSTERSENSQ